MRVGIAADHGGVFLKNRMSETLRDAGLQVPQDVAVVGFDDVPLASVIEPALTTVRQPIERLGSMAVEVVLDMLRNEQDVETSTHRIVLPTELVVRASCGATW